MIASSALRLVVRTRTAQILVSGIFATGSRAALVSRFVRLSPKWKVMDTVPGGDTVVTLSLTQDSAAAEKFFGSEDEE